MELEKRLKSLDDKVEFVARAYTMLHNLLVKDRGFDEQTFANKFLAFLDKLERKVTDILNSHKIILHDVVRRQNDINERLERIEGSKYRPVRIKCIVDGVPENDIMMFPKDDIKIDNTIESLLKSLEDRYQLALIYRYGIHDGKKRTYKEIAKKCGRTGEYWSKAVSKALRLCRHPLRNDLSKQLPPCDLRSAIMGE